MLIKEKVTQAKTLLEEFNIDCWIIFTRESALNGDPILPYFLPGDVTWQTAILLFKSGRDVVIIGEYDKKSVEDTGAYNEIIGYVQSIKDDLQKVLKEEKPGSIAVNFSEDSEICDGITHGLFLKLQKYLEEIGMKDAIISAETLTSALRERKSPIEIELIKNAIKETEKIYSEVRDFIRPGITEKEIASFMKKKAHDRGFGFAWDERICPSVFTGPETAEAHYGPTDRKVERGHILNMDFGLKINGYCSDLQRTFYILNEGETEIPEDVRKGFDTIVTVIEECKNAMKPGVKGVEIDQIARKILKDNGYEEFPHALGHGVGRFAHDGTALLGPAWEKYGKRPFKKLEPGAVFTIEPRLKVEGKGTVTIEEMVVVTENGADWLSHPQKKIWLIS
ncbi:MAG: aminopeptidase P family protein [Candidatus Neomarinimicrobiota bacterium]|nr:MAG: aminopeptidase P family protein [Candidatus Neomarinimicrobiota bacterium]RKY50434.1 MAG: aminopeptidase P family protein [Candidatus Neomarinimicrobiota bacterium]